MVDLRGDRGDLTALEVRDPLRGRHVFNPSNFGLVVCFLLLGSARADPSTSGGGRCRSGWRWRSPDRRRSLAILRRLHLLSVAIGFWFVFAAGIAVLATTEHAMTRGAPRTDHGSGAVADPRVLPRDPRVPVSS